MAPFYSLCRRKSWLSRWDLLGFRVPPIPKKPDQSPPRIWVQDGSVLQRLSYKEHDYFCQTETKAALSSDLESRESLAQESR